MNPVLLESAIGAGDQAGGLGKREGDSRAVFAQADVLRFEVGRSDQRQHVRYPISLEIEYRLLSQWPVVRTGIGRTRNISRRGILFETTDTLPLPRAEVELLVQWPFRLDGVCRLRLVIQGRVVRSPSVRNRSCLLPPCTGLHYVNNFFEFGRNWAP